MIGETKFCNLITENHGIKGTVIWSRFPGLEGLVSSHIALPVSAVICVSSASGARLQSWKTETAISAIIRVRMRTRHKTAPHSRSLHPLRLPTDTLIRIP